MKMFKMLALFAVSTLMLLGCSEGSYVPATTTNGALAAGTPVQYINGQPVYGQNGVGMQPGFGQPGFGQPGYGQLGYNGAGINPYLANNNAYYQGLNGQAQLNLQANAQNLFSCAARATPNFYYYTSQNSNCAVRRQPTYTPESCACYRAPCNCEQVLQQTRNQCGFPNTGSTNGNNGSTTTTTSTVDCGGSVSSGINENSKTLPLSITGADAKVLYSHLAKAAVDLHNKAKTKVRTGINYKCMMDGNGKKDNQYACDIDVSVKDGVVYQQFPVGDTGVAVDANSEAYRGRNVVIGSAGLAADEAIIKIENAPAKFLFSHMNGTKSTTGSDSDYPGVNASTNLGKNMMCDSLLPDGYENTFYNCKIKVNVTTGEASVAITN